MNPAVQRSPLPAVSLENSVIRGKSNRLLQVIVIWVNLDKLNLSVIIEMRMYIEKCTFGEVMRIDIKGIFEKSEDRKLTVKEICEGNIQSDSSEDNVADSVAKSDLTSGIDVDTATAADIQLVSEQTSNPDSETDTEQISEQDVDPNPDSDQDIDTESNLDTASNLNTESNIDAEIEDNPKTESALNSTEAPSSEPTLDPTPETAPDLTPEPNSDLTPETAPTEEAPAKLAAEIRKYMDLIVIAAVFILLAGTVFYYTNMIPREVYASIDGESEIITSKAWTVEEFLETEGIAYCSEDYISMPVTGFIHDGIEITIQHATNYKITADGQTKAYKTLEKTAAKALREEGIILGENDIVEPGLDALIEEGITIVVKRVKIEEKTIEEKVPFKTETRKDSSMNKGDKEVVQKGKDGKAEVTYRITYIDGKEASRKKLKSKTIVPAEKEIVKEGTRATIDGFAYTRTMTVKAYSYTGGGRTAMGTKARVGEIAVDPGVIPLGTSVYIEGVGVRRAEDTGGNIKGKTIDIYMNSRSECLNWGCRYVTIYLP